MLKSHEDVCCIQAYDDEEDDELNYVERKTLTYLQTQKKLKDKEKAEKLLKDKEIAETLLLKDKEIAADSTSGINFYRNELLMKLCAKP